MKKGARKQGLFFVVGFGPLSSSAAIQSAEGYSTAATLAMATHRSVVMAVDAGNLPVVALELQVIYPESKHCLT